MKKILILISIFIFTLSINAQRKIKEAATIPMFSASYAFQFPQQDMAERFGNNSNIGVAFTLKGEKGWLLGIDANYMFGSDLKENKIFKNLMTSNGNIINEYGEYANIILSERGYFAGIKLGKIINLFPASPNSGLYVTGSIGFLEHKIRIENQGNNAPQIIEDYSKGYDRLTNGLAAKGFVGYIHIGKKQLANFYGGIEYLQSWTQNRRSFNFDTYEADIRKRNDNLIGIRIGWIIPLYRRVPDDYFTF
ncbi:MAG: hypothetical protein U9R19_08405 [Bacteroidota bacterium]|nr:hypothetical protein [Bacteroidota bacterium]